MPSSETCGPDGAPPGSTALLTARLTTLLAAGGRGVETRLLQQRHGDLQATTGRLADRGQVGLLEGRAVLAGEHGDRGGHPGGRQRLLDVGGAGRLGVRGQRRGGVGHRLGLAGDTEEDAGGRQRQSRHHPLGPSAGQRPEEPRGPPGGVRCGGAVELVHSYPSNSE